MSTGLARAWDALWGRGDFSVTVPSMDGALRPNTLLDDAMPLLQADNIDNLATTPGGLCFTQGAELMLLTARGFAPRHIRTFDASVSAVAAAPDGRMAIALESGSILLLPSPETGEARRLDVPAKGAATAMSFAPDGALLVATGSARHAPARWKQDLMSAGSSGAVLRIAPSGAAHEELGTALAFPAGVAVDGNGAVIISEAWQHRVLRSQPGGTWQAVLWDLPGYPGRITPAEGGGFWLSIFAPRSQMVEFVLREKAYRERMMASVPEDFWMAPTLRAGKSFKEPLQGGGVKHLGIQKPWGPTRSYGLLVRLGPDLQPIDSFHSRSDGRRHGITSSAEWDGLTIASSKGDGVLVALVKNTEDAAS